MDFNKINDYELLYLYHDCKNERAFELLLAKYDIIIRHFMNTNNVKGYLDYDDVYQELVLAFYEAVRKFNQDYGKSFYNFSSLIIERKYARLWREEIKWIKQKKALVGGNLAEDPKYLDRLENQEIINKNLKYLRDSNISPIDLKVLEDVIIKKMPTEEFLAANNMKREELYYRKKKINLLLEKNRRYNL